MRFDHYLAQQKDKLSLEAQLDLVRQLAEVMRFAHDRKIVHRGLSPQSVLVVNPRGDRPRLKVYNWQVGYRETATATPVSRVVTPTSHVERLVEDLATAYMAPEAFTEDNTGEHLDVFSLGAIAFHVFSGSPPASCGLELAEKLRGTKGLQISSVLNGAGEWLELMIEQATHPIVGNRTDSVADFQGMLDEVENELSTPEHDYVDDPTQAQAGAVLPGGYKVLRRLGQGACSVALLVERDGQDFVVKIAHDTQHNARLQGEADVLTKLRHTNIVEYVASVEMGDRAAFLLRPAYADKEKRLIETIGQRLRKDGRLQIELLERFGDDLLQAVNYLEEQGIPHRDIKPDNIAVGMIGRGSRLRLVLFDFSLSRTSPDNIRAGTTGYLDPLLPLRDPVGWDLHAERYAVAVTLHELATGVLPKWGDGETDPSQLAANVEITIDAELFDPALRSPLTKFFTKALRRSIRERFHNGEEMQRAWGECFKGLDEPSRLSDHADEAQLDALLANASFETQVSELGLGARATNALDRANILTVEDLLIAPMRRLMRLRGVGNKTRREITTAVKILRKRLGKPDREPPPSSESQDPTQTTDVAGLSVDILVDRLLRTGSKDGDTFQQASKLVLGLGPQPGDGWLSQAEIAGAVQVTRGRIGQIVGKLQQRWAKDPTITRLRTDLAEILAGQGGVASPRELGEALLVARGSSQDEPLRSRFAAAVVRAAVEVENSTAEPRFQVSRRQDRILVARNTDLAAYARRLGEVADQIAAEDPLVAPARVVERLREVAAPSDAQLSDARLLRLSAEASQSACVSSRGELYPRGLAPARALKLSQGALLGRRQLTVAQIHERVAGRYPAAAPLPDRPGLDDLLREAGFEFVWNAEAKDGGCYESPLADRVSVTSGSQSVDRFSTSQESTTVGQVGEVTPDVADAREFEERLQRSLKEGSFLTLLVNPKYYERARGELGHRYPLEPIDLEELIMESLRVEAEKARVQWELVLETDGKPRDGDWDKLMMLVGRAMPAVERRMLSADRTMLVVYAGLLARYGQMDLLSKLSQKVGRTGGIPGLWLLVPGDAPLLDGKAVPLIGPGQRARIPESWLQNLHRADHLSPTLPVARCEGNPEP